MKKVPLFLLHLSNQMIGAERPQRAFLFLIFFTLKFSTIGQVEVNPIIPQTSYEDLIRSEFAAEDIVVLGVRALVDYRSIGIFSGTQSALGVSEGLVITSGRASEILGDPSVKMSSELNPGSDQNLNNIYDLDGRQDIQVLRIEFVPLGDSLDFSFIYGSEHYEGLECRPDYDLLEAHLSRLDKLNRLDPIGNMITVPGKPDIPVNANTINGGAFNSLTTHCFILDTDWRDNEPFYAGSDPAFTFNGFTEVLPSRKMAVTPLQRYQLDIILAEGSSPNNDSGLFLERSSFTSNRIENKPYVVLRRAERLCDTLIVGNTTITETGTYFIKLTDETSPIDTFVNFLAVTYRPQTTEYLALCPGDSIEIADTVLYTPTSYTITTTAANGCDSTITYEVYFNNSFGFTAYEEYDLCLGDTLFILDTFFTESVLYREVREAEQTCDSAFYYNVRFANVLEVDEFVYACPGDSVWIQGNLFLESGSVQDTIIGTEYCDTIKTIHVRFQELSIELDENFTGLYCEGTDFILRKGQDFIVQESPEELTFSRGEGIPLPDGTGVSYESALYVSAFPTGETVEQLGGIVEICVNMEHSWLFDLDIFLQAPDGTILTLQEQTFIVDQVFLGEPVDMDVNNLMPGVGYQYCWTSEAPYTWTEYHQIFDLETLPAGDYAIPDIWSKLNSSRVNGEWQLIVQDLWAVDNGFLFDWSISFSTTENTIVEQGWINPEVAQYHDDSTLVANLPAGDYSFDYYVINQNGCRSEISIPVQVGNDDLPTVIDTAICQPTVILDTLISEGGTYELTFGPPDYCTINQVTLNVQWVDPPDTTYINLPTCRINGAGSNTDVLVGELGCDSIIVTTFELQLDTQFQQLFYCDTLIAAPDTTRELSYSTEGDCDIAVIYELIRLPLDTTFLFDTSCRPEDVGMQSVALSNQFGCDSLIITQTDLLIDTIYNTLQVCSESEVGLFTSLETGEDGCVFTSIETRLYVPFEYAWEIVPDTCRFGQGSAELIPLNTDFTYELAWSGPTDIIKPDSIFSGVYNVTITGTDQQTGHICTAVEQIVVGNVEDLPDLDFTYDGGELSYAFVGTVANANEFYWDFGDSTTSVELNPAHVYDEPGTYLVCLVAQNNCNSTQVCEVLQTPDWYSIGGIVETSKGQNAAVPINGVELELSYNEQELTTTSANDGTYTLGQQFEGIDYTILPSKENDLLNGLDVADLIRLSQYVNGSRTLILPDQLLAGDIDCNEEVDMQDVMTLQSMLLGGTSDFEPGCSSWIFWPQSYVFDNPEAPFGHPTSITIEGLNMDVSTADFYGLKRGDLGGNADAARGGAPPDSLFLRLKNAYVSQGEAMQLDFRVENFEELVGFQVELKYDTAALDFQEVILGEVPGLDEEHFGLSKVGDGVIRVIWLDLLGNYHTLDDGALAFGLRFQAKQEITDRSEHIAVDSRELSAASFNAELVEGPVALKVDLLTALGHSEKQTFKLFQNQPNPFDQETIIPFYLPNSCQATLVVYNAAGQKIWEKSQWYTAGRQEENVSMDRPGVYYYSLITPWGKRTKHMIITK